MELLRSLAITGTEEVLSISGLILLLAAGWGGDKASRAISIAAVSGASEPCTEFSPMLSAHSLRIVPASAFSGLVAPITSR